MKKQSKIYTFVITIGATLLIGPVVWAVWKWGGDLFPFLITWLIVHPVYKIWRELGDL